LSRWKKGGRGGEIPSRKKRGEVIYSGTEEYGPSKRNKREL